MLENIGYQIKTKKMYLERIKDTAVFFNKQTVQCKNLYI